MNWVVGLMAFTVAAFTCYSGLGDQAGTKPLVMPDLIFAEDGGTAAVEAEHFFDQTKTLKRAWHIISGSDPATPKPDSDPSHFDGASGNAYLEILPDTRKNHSEKLIHGENFSNKPGVLGVLSYKVHFANPGRYYVWVRAYSTGTEDNGIHVGLNGEWPDSGQRLQWCTGKNSWYWDSKQRTQEVHCGEPGKIFLDIPSSGVHTIHFSMREDGFEFDKFILTRDRDFKRPDGAGPGSRIYSGKIPSVKAASIKRPAYPDHWGNPPRIQTRDLRPLPGGYGMGSSTLARWIQKNLDSDRERDNQERPHGNGAISLEGEMKQWHKVTLNLTGPYADEKDTSSNPFTDFRMTVDWTHKESATTYSTPGYFAADGNAAETSASRGNIWRAHFAPDRVGTWEYKVAFVSGKNATISTRGSETPLPWSGKSGSISVVRSDKSGRDFRNFGRLAYVGERYLQHLGSKDYFLKIGADAPETLLAYVDFDNTHGTKKNAPLKSWKPHESDWNPGDPVWKNGKGKGLIGALNYLASTGANSFSFLPYNAGGDGNNIWPFIEREKKLHYDTSKLDQWGIVLDHATSLGLYAHFKLQENEMDDLRLGHKREPGEVPTSLDGGKLGIERKLYCRELIARFGHLLALNWNIGEENTQSPEEIRSMVSYIKSVDPYDHPIVIHTFPQQQDEVYTPLLGNKSELTGASLQNHWDVSHQRTLKWIKESSAAGKQWVVANDEQGNASFGVPPDPGYGDFSGIVTENGGRKYDLHDIRKFTLWGTLMAGGAGVEYYFGYKLPQNDLVAEDWRSRDQSWKYAALAIDAFHREEIPFHRMQSHNELIGNPNNTNDRYCLAAPGEVYLVYLPHGGTTDIDLSHTQRKFGVFWYNPRSSDRLRFGSVGIVQGGSNVSIGMPPGDHDQDWLAIIQ